MKFNISTQHMKYGRKALDFAMTPGYKRIGLLRKGSVFPSANPRICHHEPNLNFEPKLSFLRKYYENDN